MRERTAVYAGTFDPLTIGHLWMVEQGARIFDKLIVAVGVNPSKHCMFSVEERIKMIFESSAEENQNISIGTISSKYLVDYAKEMGAEYVVRGLRNNSDFLFEQTMRNVNGDLNPNITTIFLMPPRDIAEVSSSMVKGLVGPDGWERVVRKYVPVGVFNMLKEKHNVIS